MNVVSSPVISNGPWKNSPEWIAAASSHYISISEQIANA
jgi:hypothetical protein